jgi:hypothetical protein
MSRTVKVLETFSPYGWIRVVDADEIKSYLFSLKKKGENKNTIK